MNFAARIAELTQQLADKDSAHATLQASHKSLTEQLATANDQISKLTADLSKANADLSAANATIADLKPKAEKAESDIKTGIVEGIAAAGVQPVARVDVASDKIDAEDKPKLSGMAKATAYLKGRQPEPKK